jgi:hypothetical protein
MKSFHLDTVVGTSDDPTNVNGTENSLSIS